MLALVSTTVGVEQARCDENGEARVEFDVVVFGARPHVVLAGEAAVHQCLHEVPAGTLLGLVDAALAQHLRPDDRGRLLGDDGVLREVVARRDSPRARE